MSKIYLIHFLILISLFNIIESYLKFNIPSDHDKCYGQDFYLEGNLLVKYEPFKKFNTTCKETLSNCLYAIYNSNSFEDSIRKTLLMGGDTDTNCCIVGSVTESLYGMNDIQKKDTISNLPNDYVKILKKVYRQ